MRRSRRGVGVIVKRRIDQTDWQVEIPSGRRSIPAPSQKGLNDLPDVWAAHDRRPTSSRPGPEEYSRMVGHSNGFLEVAFSKTRLSNALPACLAPESLS